MSTPNGPNSSDHETSEKDVEQKEKVHGVDHEQNDAVEGGSEPKEHAKAGASSNDSAALPTEITSTDHEKNTAGHNDEHELPRSLAEPVEIISKASAIPVTKSDDRATEASAEASLSAEKKVADAGSTTTPSNMQQEENDERLAIQNEAIEHLARRAADMHMQQPHTPDSLGRTKDDKLPASPPPPTPPEKESVDVKMKAAEDDFDEKQGLDDSTSGSGTGEQTGVEIQSILDQFGEGVLAPGEQEIMSPRLEKQQPVMQLPPRTSSLEAEKYDARTPAERATETYFTGVPSSHRNSIISIQSRPATAGDDTSSIKSHRTSIFQPPPPTPDPDPVLPFDFHRFLEQLRHRTADPVARYLRSFLQEFGKKNWMVHEQVKIIGDFLDFISKKMSQCEVWRSVSDAEFDNAREGMEKLVMNRLYTQTFSPAIPPPASPRKKNRNAESSSQPGRRGQHQEDVERDDVIAQKMRIYGWINEAHLDIKPIGDKGRKFLTMAQQELLKINTYRAPRDKVICVLNCCKVIFGFLKNNSADQSADSFVPLLIYTVLQARPEHLVSNVQYIWRFRNQEKLGGEAGYYMSSLMGVVTFLENLDRTMITVTDEEFEKNVEQAVSAIAEGHAAQAYESQAHTASVSTPPRTQHLVEKSASRPEVTARHSADVEQSPPKKNAAQRLTFVNEADRDDDPVTGLLRSIQKPLSSIGRIFSDESVTSSSPAGARSSSTPLPPRTSSRNLYPAAAISDRASSEARRSAERSRSSQRVRSDEAEARQASVETAEIQRERQRGFGVVVETLQGMFPNLDKEIIEDVVRAQEGNVGRAVDACLALSDQT